jgi:PIN domain nuclease of toxin-antitoxin system
MNRFLLDTHVFLWFIQGDTTLTNEVQRVITDDSNALYFSIVSLWEIIIKVNIGKLKIDYTIAEIYTLLEQLKIEVIPIDPSDLAQYQPLPLHHRDPFDRLLIAQAIERSLILVSADREFAAYPVPLLQN